MPTALTPDALILLYVSSYFYICVLILLHVCPHATTHVLLQWLLQSLPRVKAGGVNLFTGVTHVYFYTTTTTLLLLLHMCPHALAHMCHCCNCCNCLQSLSRVKAVGVNLFTEHDAVLLKSISDLLGPHLVSLRLRACRYSLYLLY